MPFRADLVATMPDGRQLVRMLCEVEHVVEQDKAQWIHILPLGPIVIARDGRTFQVSDALSVAGNTETPLLVDWEHDSEFGRTRAAGWIEKLEIERQDGARFPHPGLWGRVDWTEEGKKDVSSRAFRFLSPVVVIEQETRDAQLLVSVALTNRPALTMAAIDAFKERCSARFGLLSTGEKAMQPETKKALCSQLGVADSASDAAILEALASRTGSATSLQEMCTRLTNDLGDEKRRAQELTQRLAANETQAFEAEVDRVLAQASKEGRITPAQAKEWRTFALKGPEHFEQFSKNVLPNLPPGKGDKAPPPPKDGASSSKQAVSAFGYPADKIARARAYIAEKQAAYADEED